MKYFIALWNILFPPEARMSARERGYAFATKELNNGLSPCEILAFVQFTGAKQPFEQGMLAAIHDHAKKSSIPKPPLWGRPMPDDIRPAGNF